MKTTLNVLVAYGRRKKLLFSISVFLILIAGIFSNILNFAYAKIFETIQEENFEEVEKYIFIGALVFFISIIAEGLGFYLIDKFNSYLARDIRIDVVSQIHKLDFSYHASKSTGKLISTIKRGDSAVGSFSLIFSRNLTKVTIDFIFIVTTFATLNLLLSGVILLVSVLSIAISIILVKLNVKIKRDFNLSEDQVSGIIVDNLTNFETVKYFAKEKRERKRLEKSFKKWVRIFWDYSRSYRSIEICVNTLSFIGIIISILIAANDVQNGKLEPAAFILIISFVLRFFPNLLNIVYNIREIVKNHTDLENYIQLLNEPVTVPEAKDSFALKDVRGEIEFSNVEFDYPERKGVIKGINLKIKDGESVAFVGQSGAGKTTLTKLLLRFYDVTNGAIKIDNIDIRKVTKESLRKTIGIVPQDPIMFNETIEYNLGYGQDKLNKEKIIEAAKLANLHEFIVSLPKKYKTIVGERGIKLSGGQKQRLAIARVFLTNPQIIIFDEATSQLDSESEKLIQDAFWKLAKGKTVIIIAHRLSTVLNSDRIIVMQNGEIIQEGKHFELINKDGEYKKLWEIQKGGKFE